MNTWVEKSINLAKSKGYLDKLFDIYSVEPSASRDLPKEKITAIRKARSSRNQKRLFMILLSLKKFPIDNPYVASMRKHQFLIAKNPKTIRKINRRIALLSNNKLFNALCKPKSASRQLGASFRKWIPKIGYPILEEDEFKRGKYRVAFLKGSDAALKKYANRELGFRLRRGIDFILKIKNKTILGEAKFLSSDGGTQNSSFDTAIRVSRIRKGKNIMGVAVLDGIVWFRSDKYMHRTVIKTNSVVLSALLLKSFIRELAQ